MVNYLKDNILYTFILEVVIVLFIIFIIFIFKIRIDTFYNINLIYTNNNIFQVLVNDKELSMIKRNNSININNKNYFYKIDKINRNVYKGSHEVFIKTNSKSKYKSLDVFNGYLFDKKISFYEMFKDVLRN